MNNEIQLGNRKVGINHAPYFIADIAANHDGDLNKAFDLIELAKESGADAAKFQHFKAETIVSKKTFDKMKFKFSHQKKWKKSGGAYLFFASRITLNQEKSLKRA